MWKFVITCYVYQDMDKNENSADRNITAIAFTIPRMINKKKMTGRSVVNLRGAPTLRRNIYT